MLPGTVSGGALVDRRFRRLHQPSPDHLVRNTSPDDSPPSQSRSEDGERELEREQDESDGQQSLRSGPPIRWESQAPS
jgi:hypothetical protein